tara:strand:+ start:3404 stop:3811 length:408 start_codon:yes stop_codon:yes gene_type:complete
LENGEKLAATNSLGFHLYTKGGVGFQLGKIQRQLLYPGITDTGTECLKGIGSSNEKADEVRIEADTEKSPSRISVLRYGVGVDVSFSGIRMILGMNHRNESRTDLRLSSSSYYRSGGELNLDEACSVIKKRGKTK